MTEVLPSNRIRLSIIDYLNALPLNLAFKDGLFADRTTLCFDYPSLCADHLAAGHVDGGLISSIEYQRMPNLKMVAGIGIASRHEARSVLIVTRRELPDVRSMAMDRFSRSSEALTRILFHRLYGRDLHALPMAPELPAMLERCDAALIIGDPALKLVRRGLIVYDLARLWFDHTGLPFVFAFWALRANKGQSAWAQLLREAKDYGMSQFSARLEEWSTRWGLPAGEIHHYLTENIHYDLAESEMASLHLFFRYACEAGLLGELRPLDLLY
jgi:predicted solute-binding protein